MFLTAVAYANMAQAAQYTVWSSFVILRTGEHTPALYAGPKSLTPVGAQQVYSVGQALRAEYLEDNSPARIPALNAYEPLQNQIIVSTYEDQPLIASSQSFMLGMYPPTMSSSDGLGTMADGTTIYNPQAGFQFPFISTSNSQDENSIYLAGNLVCPAFTSHTNELLSSKVVSTMRAESQTLYDSIQNFLDPVLIRSNQTFASANEIYEYMSYLNVHNSTVSSWLSQNPAILPGLKFYADMQQTTMYTGSSNSSIVNISGSSLAYKITEHFSAIQSNPTSTQLVSIMVQYYSAMSSLFSLLNLTTKSLDFQGVPLLGSAVVFELVSSPVNNGSIPEAQDLYVRFRIRNGTGVTGSVVTDGKVDFTSYALFNQSDADLGVPLNEFLTSMKAVSISNVGDWCSRCGAITPFCAVWNNALSLGSILSAIDASVSATASLVSPTSSTSKTHTQAQTGSSPQYQPVQTSKSMSPVVAGVIGAVITLFVTLLLILLLCFIFGIRTKRTSPIWSTNDRHSRRNGDSPTSYHSSRFNSKEALLFPQPPSSHSNKSPPTQFSSTFSQPTNPPIPEMTTSTIPSPVYKHTSANNKLLGHNRNESWDIDFSPEVSPQLPEMAFMRHRSGNSSLRDSISSVLDRTGLGKMTAEARDSNSRYSGYSKGSLIEEKEEEDDMTPLRVAHAIRVASVTHGKGGVISHARTGSGRVRFSIVNKAQKASSDAGSIGRCSTASFYVDMDHQ